MASIVQQNIRSRLDAIYDGAKKQHESRDDAICYYNAFLSELNCLLTQTIFIWITLTHFRGTKLLQHNTFFRHFVSLVSPPQTVRKWGSKCVNVTL